MTASSADFEAVAALLGRSPQGDFDVVVRDAGGEPLVVRNAPLLHDGTPMPTRYWLTGREAVRRVSRLEAAGGVRRAEAEVVEVAITAAHDRYAAERDAALPPGWEGPRPHGGVGGTRTGVKCLHAHYAHHLAGGDDPVGRWVAAQLAGVVLQVMLGEREMRFRAGEREFTVPVGAITLAEMVGGDPPDPADLTNAIGLLADHLDDVVRELPAAATAEEVEISGHGLATIAAVEVGGAARLPFVLGRRQAEEVFRTLATETRADRQHNPGLPAAEVHEVLGVCCAVVALLRRLDRPAVRIVGVDGGVR